MIEILTPSVIGSEAKAILHEVRVESRDSRGVVTFWAITTYGNPGGRAMEFRLVRRGGRWVSQPTGNSAVC
jgi:hypothetical protein